ncbi:serologically defined colon cancer antigen 1 [Reticulomyxa filosa]|uniref:Serologically defined colon cancer antigen 1 n=1 Tax=Reticulomyxa filosa TaxID=46433 RepID=X6LZZ4_RETFI|nr:serologically defined colon cancer antigen 1 [Reticulomyxa filosa]|eukprot:ETO06727.1 serologically defined colon cancer antigen 1 [Reticulomyxa filosa]
MAFSISKSDIELPFGRYEGYWEDPKHDVLFEIVIDGSNFKSTRESGPPFSFEGFHEWRLLKAPEDWPELRANVGMQAMELLRGFYYDYDMHSNAYQFIALGFCCVEPSQNTGIIQSDGYKIQMDKPDGFLKHVASKKELITLLTELLEEPGIVKVLASMLHHFERPIYEKPEINPRKWKRQLDVMPADIRPLFNDIPSAQPVEDDENEEINSSSSNSGQEYLEQEDLEQEDLEQEDLEQEDLEQKDQVQEVQEQKDQEQQGQPEEQTDQQ